MRKERAIRLFLSIMTIFILMVSVLASVDDISNTEVKESDYNQLEIKQPSQPKEGTKETEEEPICKLERECNNKEESKLIEDNLVIEEIAFEEESSTLPNDLLSTPLPSSSSTFSYVIITSNDILANSKQLDFFIHHKELAGHTVKVITEDNYKFLIGQSPNERADKIRKWLQLYDPVYNIDYVLMIGDPDPDDPKNPFDTVGDVPMKMTYSLYHGYWDWCEPTDYYYADLKGNWDLDGDGFFGETWPVDAKQSPYISIEEDYFSIRWKGFFRVDTPGQYEFHTYSDDAARLWIDGNQVINHWVSHPPTYKDVTLNMTAGFHTVKLEYREDEEDAQITFAWTIPGDSYPSLIPKDNLYDELASQGALTGYYYDDPDFSEFKMKRDDPEIYFFWGSGDKGSGGPLTGGDVYVGRIPVYDQDYAQLDQILRKIIDYETDPGDISWRESILLPMVPHSDKIPGYPLGEHIKYGIADPAGFSSYRIYEEDYSVGPEKTPCNCTNTVSEWKKGYGVVVWAAHGGIDGAEHVIDNTYLHELDDTKPSFTFQASCANGDAEYSYNIGYSLLKHGAIATVSSTKGSGHDGNDPTWPLNPSWDVNHNFAYYYTEKLVWGHSAGYALFETKRGFSSVDINGIRYNLYGDPDCYLISTLPNLPPVADPNGPYVVDEGSPVVFDGSASYDPEGDPLEYRWDFEDDGTWDTDWSTDSSASFTWGDDYTGQARLEVRDLFGKTGNETANVNIYNVAPTIENVEAYILVDFTLRAAGEKWHNVEMYILEDGAEIGYAEVVRYPGSPDDQSETLFDIKCNVTHVISVKVLYTPLNDKVNGQPNGATPCWVNVSFEDGGYNLTHNTFNVRHPDTWEWIIGVNKFFLNHEMTFEADASDVGSDDLTLTWEWDDGTADSVTTYYNNGVGPDPYPSTDGTYPFFAADVAKHTFTVSGTYNVVLTVSDDDGGSSSVVLVISFV
ncbi:MAG: hypothetical protein JSV09_00845 [Thermoplasmata archaeon]|nr:MAG: hypothetical protein JSV09_00845 [Thermoplasmata archaeon]